MKNQKLTFPEKTLQIKWTNRVERIEDKWNGLCPVYEGINEKGEKVRIHIMKYEVIGKEK